MFLSKLIMYNPTSESWSVLDSSGPALSCAFTFVDEDGFFSVMGGIYETVDRSDEVRR